MQVCEASTRETFVCCTSVCNFQAPQMSSFRQAWRITVGGAVSQRQTISKAMRGRLGETIRLSPALFGNHLIAELTFNR
jgi:hypothetical protein